MKASEPDEECNVDDEESQESEEGETWT